MSSVWVIPTALRNLVNSVSKKREPQVIKEVTLDGLDKESKEAIINYLREKDLKVSNVDDELYTVDMSKLDVERHKEFMDFLQSLENCSDNNCTISESKDTRAAGSEATKYTFGSQRGSARNSIPFDGVVEVEDISDDDEIQETRPYPRTLHPIEEMQFEFLRPRLFPVEPYQVSNVQEIRSNDEILEKERRRPCQRIRDCFQKGHRECIKCLVCPFSKLCWCIFSFMSNISEKRYNRKTEKIKKEEGYQIYTSILQNRNPFAYDASRTKVFVDTAVNTHEYQCKSSRENSTMTDPPVTDNIGINTSYYSNFPKSGCNMSILTPEILSLSNMQEEQLPNLDKSINAVVPVADTGSYAPLSMSDSRRFYGSSIFDVNDTPQAYSTRNDVDEVEESSMPDVNWVCPCEAFTGVFKGLNRYVNTLRLADDNSSTSFTGELLRQQTEIGEVKKMLESAIMILNKKYS